MLFARTVTQTEHTEDDLSETWPLAAHQTVNLASFGIPVGSIPTSLTEFQQDGPSGSLRVPDNRIAVV